VRDFLRGNKWLPTKALAWDATYSDGKLAYVLKGCTPLGRELLAAMFETEYERQHFLDGTKEKTIQGMINGKRLLISQALGRKARLGGSNGNVKTGKVQRLPLQAANVCL
jgi:hypothetical protein